MRLCACIILITLFITNTWAQENNFFRHLESSGKLEFKSSGNKAAKILDVKKNNRYTKLNFQATHSPVDVNYKVAPSDKAGLLKSFFLEPKSSAGKLNPTRLKASSDVLMSENHVVVADHLTMYGEGILGVKSTASVFDKNGTRIATLPENNDGYFSPVVTSDAKYLGTNYGDFADDVDFTLLPFPGFRIYDLKTNEIIMDLGATAEFDVYPPSTRHNMIIEVLAYRGSIYEYLFIQPATKNIYKRKFTGEEVGRFVRFTAEGVVIKENGKEKLIAFNKDFIHETF